MCRLESEMVFLLRKGMYCQKAVFNLFDILKFLNGNILEKV